MSCRHQYFGGMCFLHVEGGSTNIEEDNSLSMCHCENLKSDMKQAL